MKKKLVIIFVIICIITGGYIAMKYVEKKKQEEQFWKKQEARVEKYIRYNVKDVKSITFTKREITPMGIPHINGYINQDDKLWFIASVSTTKDFEEQLTRSGELGKLIKEPEKSVSEIEKEEKR
ncbi:DUF1433 domain-containing protein [Bacillus nitratireducens]|uniref:DUF1433 domain-containing protein n=1 Tax=Bacillus nitratireducens TaxID=2026193 RepID=UPI0008FE7C70|nr:DUF1433 domain-containing protein [Bacillus nitratireducens]OJD48769.1 hypothetical protein BAU23_14845 [Bacillus nitratireducens]